MSNFFIMLFGIIHLFAIAGGLWFWILTAVSLYRNRPLSGDDDEHCCENCQSYKICVDLMGDCLPDYPCAYWEKKKS